MASMIVSRFRIRGILGFTMVEMLVTTLILVLASSLMATGIPAAVDTYRKTVKSSNAQIALSTTLTVLRSELGMATTAVIDGDRIYYKSVEGTWASIGGPVDHAGKTYHGLEKQYYSGDYDGSLPSHGLTPIDGAYYPLVSDSAISDDLRVVLATIDVGGSSATFTATLNSLGQPIIVVNNLYVQDTAGNRLAGVGGMGPEDGYGVLLRFTS